MLPENIDSWIDLAELYFTEMQDPDMATLVLKECLYANPKGSDEVITRMSIYALLTGDTQTAEQLLLSIADKNFNYEEKMLNYDETLAENPNFCKLMELLKQK